MAEAEPAPSSPHEGVDAAAEEAEMDGAAVAPSRRGGRQQRRYRLQDSDDEDAEGQSQALQLLTPQPSSSSAPSAPSSPSASSSPPPFSSASQSQSDGVPAVALRRGRRHRSPSPSPPPPSLPPSAAVRSSSSSSFSSSSSSRYRLRSPSSTGHRLSQVDAVLDRLKRQRRNEEGRAWIDSDQHEGGGGEKGEEREEGEEEEEPEKEQLQGHDGRDARLSSAVSSRTRPSRRRRPQPVRPSAEWSEGAEDDDNDAAFIADSDEEEEEGEAGGSSGGGGALDARADAEGHMALHHALQMEQEGLGVDEDEDVLLLHSSATSASSPRSAAVLSSSLFASSLALTLPLDVSSAFRFYSLYHSAVLVDGGVSGWVRSLPSTRRLMAAAQQKVEETFLTQMRQWVQSQVWEQAGRALTFLSQLDRLPYATSTRRPPTADLIDPDTGRPTRAEQQPPTCQACGKPHQLTHIIQLYGVPYVAEQLEHPFDSDRLFSSHRRHHHHTDIPAHH